MTPTRRNRRWTDDDRAAFRAAYEVETAAVPYVQAIAAIGERFGLTESQVKVYALRWDCHRKEPEEPTGRVYVTRERTKCLRCPTFFFAPFKLVEGRVRLLERVCRTCKTTEDWISGQAEYDTGGWEE